MSKFGYFQPYIIVSYNDEMIVARYESQQIVQKIMTDKNLFPTKREILYATYTNCWSFHVALNCKFSGFDFNVILLSVTKYIRAVDDRPHCGFTS